ncbi:dihydrofolate reductase family protein [Actinomadura barringtoniae]|uniref:Dihydrofolate reductase family protein n=1 Tax=Actinomadura barringtoniae TaxID=1427535 RepID=A0A939PB33_9ACTN|nr:dihydrofolate reductase family protein [Actinomadura barringtoniae]MBO2449158.1 dihydrofolate reductase family protein [Actinomadura barringtoniae]
MGKLIISENVTLDGVTQDPTGEEGLGHGSWFFDISDKDREAWTKVELAEAMAAEALLLGRRTDEWFATRWLARTGEWADRLNGMPKYVVSSTIDEPRWGHGTVISGDVAKEVSKLKEQLDGDLVVYASLPLVHTLMENDLVDELRLTVYPVVLGSGNRLFGEAGRKATMRLTNTQPLGDSLVHLTYKTVPNA